MSSEYSYTPTDFDDELEESEVSRRFRAFINDLAREAMLSAAEQGLSSDALREHLQSRQNDLDNTLDTLEGLSDLINPRNDVDDVDEMLLEEDTDTPDMPPPPYSTPFSSATETNANQSDGTQNLASGAADVTPEPPHLSWSDMAQAARSDNRDQTAEQRSQEELDETREELGRRTARLDAVGEYDYAFEEAGRIFGVANLVLSVVSDHQTVVRPQHDVQTMMGQDSVHDDSVDRSEALSGNTLIASPTSEGDTVSRAARIPLDFNVNSAQRHEDIRSQPQALPVQRLLRRRTFS